MIPCTFDDVTEKAYAIPNVKRIVDGESGYYAAILSRGLCTIYSEALFKALILLVNLLYTTIWSYAPLP